MPVAEAAGARLEKYRPDADRAALEELAAWCEAFSPMVGLEEAEFPESLLLDITRTHALFGGEHALAEQAAKGLSRRGFVSRLAIADTIGAAWAAARHADPLWIVAAGETASALAKLPIAALRISGAMAGVLAELGIREIGQLLAVPRSALAGRFEPELLQRIHQFTGVAPEQVVAHHAPPDMIAERQLEYPCDRREAIESLLAQLIDQVVVVLKQRQQGVLRLECQLECEAAETLRFEVGLFEASSHSRHLQELVRARMERVRLPGAVVTVRLAVLLAARLSSRQRCLFGDGDNTRRELALLVDRLSSRLGRETVVRPVLVCDAQPECAYRCESLAGGKPSRSWRPGALPFRPLLVEPRPLPLEVLSVVPDGPPIRFGLHGCQHRVVQSWGPERIQTGWWRGNYIHRDYYRVATADGGRYWLFRSRGHWFLHGTFD